MAVLAMVKVKSKVKLCRCRYAGAKGKSIYSSYSFLTSAASSNGRALTPGKDPLYQLDRRLGGSPIWSGHRGQRKKLFASIGDRTPVVLSVVRHYFNKQQ
jgi:hypothetical protein